MVELTGTLNLWDRFGSARRIQRAQRIAQRIAILTFVFAIFIVIGESDAQVQEKIQELFTKKQKATAEFVPDTPISVGVCFPRRIATEEKYDIFPREIITAWGKKELGFDPMLINQATFIVEATETLDQPYRWAAVLHFEEMQGLSGDLIDRLDEKKLDGKVLFSGNGWEEPSFLIYDETTILVGDEGMFGSMVQSDESGPLARLLKSPSVKGEVMMFLNIEQMRPILSVMTDQMPQMLPPAITKLKQVPENILAAEIGFEVKNGVETTIVLHAKDEETVEDIKDIFADAVELGKEMGVGLLASQMDFSDPVQEATVEYVQRLAEHYEGMLVPKTDGNKLTLQLQQELAVAPFLVGMALPAVQQVRAAARRTQSMNNARQAALAFLNYESAHGKMPTQANYDKNGRPLLSWRVHMLPYLEQNDLYEQFHLDEPWDSPHNKKLIRKMPEVYSSPSVAVAPGKTVYLGIAGENTAFGKDPLTFSDIKDGTSNTAMIVEANPSHAVEWTRPKDWEPDQRDPMSGLGNVNPGGFIVTLMDGSTQFMSNQTDPEQWKSMWTIAGDDGR